MKVAISFFNSILGGPREVTINLLKQIPLIDDTIEYVVYTDTNHGLEFLNTMPNVSICIIKKFGKYDLFFWEQILAPIHAVIDGIDVFHGTKNAVPFFGVFKKICTIHDLAYYIMPDTFSFMQRVHLKISATVAKIVSKKIVAVSHNTAKDIQTSIGADEKNLQVIYNAVDESFYDMAVERDQIATKEQLSLPDRFFLHVGTLQPRKNITTIIKGFVKCKATDENNTFLVLAGRKGWYFEEIINIVQESGYKDCIIFTGPVTHVQLKSLYALAYGFIYASNYDGFGLVPLEAMASGIPTICSNNSSLPEVVGEDALLINEKSSDDICSRMQELADDVTYSSYATRGVQRSKLFSWKKSAEEYVKLYKEVAGS